MYAMDIDRFFTLGPAATAFQANDVFTNRETYLEAFRVRALEHCARSWDAGLLMDFQRPAGNVMTIIGEGGIGKSALARRLALLSINGELTGLPQDCATVVVDFADTSNRSFETALLRVRAALGRLGRSWPALTSR
jgi:hypothetical protein